MQLKGEQCLKKIHRAGVEAGSRSDQFFSFISLHRCDALSLPLCRVPAKLYIADSMRPIVRWRWRTSWSQTFRSFVKRCTQRQDKLLIHRNESPLEKKRSESKWNSENSRNLWEAQTIALCIPDVIFCAVVHLNRNKYNYNVQRKKNIFINIADSIFLFRVHCSFPEVKSRFVTFSTSAEKCPNNLRIPECTLQSLSSGHYQSNLPKWCPIVIMLDVFSE